MGAGAAAATAMLREITVGLHNAPVICRREQTKCRLQGVIACRWRGTKLKSLNYAVICTNTYVDQIK